MSSHDKTVCVNRFGKWLTTSHMPEIGTINIPSGSILMSVLRPEKRMKRDWKASAMRNA